MIAGVLLYNRVYDMITQVGQDVVDDLRFAPLAAEFAAARERRGLDLKAAAKALKRPQYVVRQIEQGRLAELDPRGPQAPGLERRRPWSSRSSCRASPRRSGAACG